MGYQVLARQWRPQRFADLIGQDAVVRTLQNAIASGKLGQAYLFSGLRGVGKTTAARLLAKAVNCEHGPTPEPCGECLPCREITEGIALDVIEVDAATRTGVDEIRELQEVVRYRPTRDRYRVLIVDEVHMLSASAFNALLKSIEEPPPYLLWIFATTERQKVPATVLSRCQELEFRPVAPARIAEHLLDIAGKEGFALDPEAAAMIARAAGGSVRDALSLTDRLRAFSGDTIGPDAVAEVLGVPRRERLHGLIEAILAGDAAAVLEGAREELRAGHDPTVLFEELGRALRSLAVAAAGAAEGETPELAGRTTVDGWTRLLGLWLELEPVVRSAAHRELALEVALLRLSRWPSVRRIEALLAGAEDGGQSPPASGGAGPRTAAGGAGGPRPRARRGGGGPDAGAAPATDGGLAEALADALWDAGQRRAAGAIRAAEVTLDGSTVRVRFPEGRGAAASTLEPVRDAVLEAARELWGATSLDLAAGGEAGGGPSPRRQAETDPGVAAAVRILGGTIESVRPDGAAEDGEGWS